MRGCLERVQEWTVSMKSKEADLTWEMKVMPVGERLMGTTGEMMAGPVMINSAAVHVIEVEAAVSVAAVMTLDADL